MVNTKSKWDIFIILYLYGDIFAYLLLSVVIKHALSVICAVHCQLLKCQKCPMGGITCANVIVQNQFNIIIKPYMYLLQLMAKQFQTLS